MKETTVLIGTLFLTLVLNFIAGFIIKGLWNWFAVSYLGLPAINIWVALGLILIETCLNRMFKTK